MTLNEYIKELTDARDQMPEYGFAEIVDAGRDELITAVSIIPVRSFFGEDGDVAFAAYVNLETETGE
tara:strand:+ start:2306 stop:2506 length:201 start_codon:yes stop_codon:yes gene_type:complete